MQEGKKASALIIFLAQFKDFMVLILLAKNDHFCFSR
ncbi:cation-transporting P-type ATPase [Bacillus sp. SL00103]